jgi:hypothetical protein
MGERLPDYVLVEKIGEAGEIADATYDELPERTDDA